jgi:methyl-accepting chemotaxis protein
MTPPIRAKDLAAYVVVLLAVLALMAGLYIHHDSRKAQIIKAAKTEQIAGEFTSKKAAITSFFNSVYTTTRTISLLPIVRAIEGGNRKNESENVVALGRFSEESHRTVQQLYNIMSAMGASEIYAIVNGFSPDKGEVPFFMYDSLLLEGQTGGEEDGKPKNPDFPEEVEDEEYAHYVKQLESFRSEHPTFSFQRLDDIPAQLSHAMRTCDNTQYVSKSAGNPRDAFGLLYSVPFYGAKNEFKGIISTIFRLNVLEALLMDAPFVIVTQRDAENALRIGLTTPAVVSPFVITNRKLGVFVGDRRDQPLISKVREVTGGAKPDDALYSEKLAIKDATGWELYYRFNFSKTEAAIAEERRLLLVELFILALFGAALTYGVRRSNVTKASARQSVASLGENNAFIKKTMETLMTASGALTRSSETQANALGSLAVALEELSSQTSENATHANAASAVSAKAAAKMRDGSSRMAVMLDRMKAMAAAVAQANRDAEDGRAALRHSNAEMREITKKSMDDIEKIVKIIENIAKQINLLAINASTEAARAGVHGKGFGVIATEIRSLSNGTSSSVESVKSFIRSAAEKISGSASRAEASANETMEKIIAEVGKVDESTRSGETEAKIVADFLGETVKAIDEAGEMVKNIAHASAEQNIGIGQAKESSLKIDGMTGRNLEDAAELAKTASDLDGQMREIGVIIERLEKLSG